MPVLKHDLSPQLLRLARAAEPDADLLARFVRSRDEAAFAAVVERHGPMVLGVCRRTLGDVHAAEDAFQATFLALTRNASRVRNPNAIAAWLYGAAVRIARNALRTDSRARATSGRISKRSSPDPLTEITGRELIAVVDEELARLPEPFRAPVVLCCLEGLSQDEVAKRLGWSRDSVKGRLERGRERLRRRLTSRGIALSSALALLTTSRAATAPPDLFPNTSRLAVSGNAPSAVAELAKAAVGSSPLPKLAAVAALILTAGGMATVGGGDPPPAPKPDAKPPAKVEPVAGAPKTDRFGDPLPKGAILRLGTTRLRHANLFALAFAADGKLVSFGGDHSVRVWNPATGQLLRERVFEKEAMHRFWSGCLSADGKRVAMQTSDRMKVFETESGKELASVKLTSASEGQARFSPDGQFLAVVDPGARAKATRMLLCDVETNTTRELCKVQGYSSEPVFSRNGRRVALAEWPVAGVGVWEVATGKELLRFKPDGLIGGTVDFDPTGDVLAVLGAVNPPQSFHYVQVSTGKPPEGWTAPPVADFNWVRFSPDGSTILFGGRESLQWCNPKTGKVLHTAEGWAATPPAFSPDRRLLAAGGENSIRFWDLESGRSADPDQEGNSLREEIHGVSVSPDGKWILTKGDSGSIRVWDSNGQMKGSIKSSRWGGRHPLFSPDGRHLFSGLDAVALVRWDFPDGKESARYAFAEPAKDHIAILDIGLSADGKRLAALTQTANRQGPGGAPGGRGAPEGGMVVTWTVWDVATARRLIVKELDGGYGERTPMFGYGAFSPDLRWYFTGDKPISSDGESDLRFILPDEWIFPRQAAVSPDGRLVAQMIGERQGGKVNPGQAAFRRVTISETATGQQVLSMPIGFCGPLDFTPDSRGLIVTDRDAITRWDLVANKAVVRHPTPSPIVGSYGNSFASSLAVSLDGRRAVTGQRDTTALVWDLPPPARRAHKLSERELSAAWDDLAGADAEKAYAAIWSLADAAGDAVPFLGARMKPVAAPPEDQIRKLVTRLDSAAFADRESAEKELLAFGASAAPTLRALLKAGVSAEQKARLDKILAATGTATVPAGDRLRCLRAVAVLEQAGTPDARKVLEDLARGAAEDRLTIEAAAARQRLR